MRRYLKRPAEIEELDDIDASLIALDHRNEGLRDAELGREIALR